MERHTDHQLKSRPPAFEPGYTAGEPEQRIAAAVARRDGERRRLVRITAALCAGGTALTAVIASLAGASSPPGSVANTTGTTNQTSTSSGASSTSGSSSSTSSGSSSSNTGSSSVSAPQSTSRRASTTSGAS